MINKIVNDKIEDILKLFFCGVLFVMERIIFCSICWFLLNVIKYYFIFILGDVYLDYCVFLKYVV